MSIIPPGYNHLLQFYLSNPMPCPYLPDREERKLFTHLSGDKIVDGEVNSTLTHAGFRRSHDIVYRPACTACNACVPVRIPAGMFTPSRNLKRIAATNRDLTLEITENIPTEEMFSLFCQYQSARHPDSEMASMTYDDFVYMLREGAVGTVLLQLRDTTQKLLGVMIADRVGDGFSAVYSFFSPDHPKRSLGTQLVLTLVSEALSQKLPHVYLGYWIASSRKMAYKARFQPLQALGLQGWDWFNPEANV